MVGDGVHFTVKPGGRLAGELRVPGDKSISHRAVMLAAIAEGSSRIEGFLQGEDALATMRAFRAMGVRVEGPEAGTMTVHGAGLRGLSAPRAPLDLGNSGTAMRLLAGLMAGQRFASTLIGDASLSARPMRRVAEPLRAMGARVETSEGGTPPLRIGPAEAPLRALAYDLPVASAQVKSALLLAGLYADGELCVTEPAPTRDHTERMLAAFGYELGTRGRTVCLRGGGRLRATRVGVPGDFSSAAFFLVGASIASGSDLRLRDVGVNPTRTGALEILRAMGADIELSGTRTLAGEPVADLRVKSAPLRGIVIPRELVPSAIDEFPAIFVAAACARGETVLSGAAELRVKESDRIEAMAEGLAVLGIATEPAADGITIEGGTLGGGEVDSRGDHRIAMAFAMAGLRARGEIRIADCANVATSFPGFHHVARACGLDLERDGSDG